MKLKLSVIAIVGLLAALAPPASAQATDFRFEASITYDTEKTGKTVVTEKYTATNLTADRVLSSFTVNAPTTKISAVNARRGDGAKIDVSTETRTGSSGDISYEFTAINLNFNQTPKGRGKSLAFTVSYVADGLVETVGAGRSIFIPGIATGTEGIGYSVEVKTPIEFGTPQIGTAGASRNGILGDKQFFSFSGAKLANRSVAMLFGDTSIYKVNLKTPIKNNWPWPRTVTVTLPPELASQRVFISSLDPPPKNTRLDADGNILAAYRLGPFQSLTVEAEVLIRAKALRYDLESSTGFGDVPPDLRAQYTGGEPLWPLAGAVAAKAEELTLAEEPVIKTVESVYNFIVDELTYNAAQLTIAPDRDAARPLDVPGQGIASDYSNLLTAMLRSRGIPARTIVGYAPSAGLKISGEVRDSLHTWVEAFVPGIGWMTLDPVWGEKFDHFGTHSVDHVALSVWGGGKHPLPAGSGTDYNYEDAVFALSKEELPPLDLGSVDFSVTRQVILPFVSVDRVRVRGADGYSVDNFASQIGDRQVLVGSLAPGERKTVNSLLAGSGWNRAADASLAQLVNGEPTDTLAQSTVEVSYVPMIVLAGLLVLLVVSIWVWKRRHAYKLLAGYKVSPAIERTDIIGDHVSPPAADPAPEPARVEHQQAGRDFTPVTPSDSEATPIQPAAEPSQPAAPAQQPSSQLTPTAPSIDGVGTRPPDRSPQAASDQVGKLIEDHPHPEPHQPGDVHTPNSPNSQE